LAAPIPLGSIVDSYLLHFDPFGNDPAVSQTLDFSITFDRPILGVILGPNLVQTDERFGLAGTQYPTGGTRGLERKDQVELSPDRRTLMVHLTGWRIDQLRVLVEAAGQDEDTELNRNNSPSQPRFSEGDPS
jgi:hypothetical protein